MECLNCGAETEFKYCNEICGGIYRRKKRHEASVQAKIDANKPCLVCGKTILTLRKKIYCSDACQQIHDKQKKPVVKIPEMRTCIYCQEEFVVRNHKQKDSCSKPGCKLNAMRTQKREKYKLMTADQKKLWKKSFPSQSTKEPTQSVLCKCPICEIQHTHVFSPAWIGHGVPRVYCDSCGSLARVRYHTSIFNDNRASL